MVSERLSGGLGAEGLPSRQTPPLCQKPTEHSKKQGLSCIALGRFLLSQPQFPYLWWGFSHRPRPMVSTAPALHLAWGRDQM